MSRAKVRGMKPRGWIEIRWIGRFLVNTRDWLIMWEKNDGEVDQPSH